MPTQNPRLSVTLTPAVAAVLRELSEVTGNSQSAIVGELMEMSVPVFERVVAGVKAAKQLQEGAKGEIAAGLERAQGKLEEQMGLMLADMDDSFRPLLEEAEKVQRRAGRAGATGAASAPARKRRGEGSTPVPVTRGSGHPRKARKGGGSGRL